LWIETKIVVGDSFFFSCLSHPASSGAGITLIKTLLLLLGVGEAEKSNLRTLLWREEITAYKRLD